MFNPSPLHILREALVVVRDLGVRVLDYRPLPASSICVSNLEFLVLSRILFLFSSSCYFPVHLVAALIRRCGSERWYHFRG